MRIKPKSKCIDRQSMRGDQRTDLTNLGRTEKTIFINLGKQQIKKNLGNITCGLLGARFQMGEIRTNE